MRKTYLLLSLVSFCKIAIAQIERPVHWSYAAKKTSETEAVILLKATIDKPWHIYSQISSGDDGPVKTEITFEPSTTYELIGKPIEPRPVTKYEDAFKLNVYYFERSVIFRQKIRLKSSNPLIKGKIGFMTCNQEKCLPPDKVDFTIQIK